MWDNFFIYRSNLPESAVGWSHFGQAHLTYLAIFTIATIVMVFIYKRGDELRKKHIQIAYAAITLSLEAVKLSICAITGAWEAGLVPLHLCSMTMIFITIHTIRSNKWTGVLLYCLSLPGAAMALIFGDWTMYPLLNFFCQQSFFIHFFEFSFPVLLLASGELRPRFSELWRALVFLLVIVPPVYSFNIHFGTNFFFLNTAAPGSPLAPLEALGMPGYFFGFAALVLVFWLIIYAPWIIKSAVEKKRGAYGNSEQDCGSEGVMLMDGGEQGATLGESSNAAQ